MVYKLKTISFALIPGDSDRVDEMEFLSIWPMFQVAKASVLNDTYVQSILNVDRVYKVFRDTKTKELKILQTKQRVIYVSIDRKKKASL